MSRICKFNIKSRRIIQEETELDITFPIYRRRGIVYTKIDEAFNEYQVIRRDQVYMLYGDPQLVWELEIIGQHGFNYDYDFYMAQGEHEAISEKEWMEAIASMLQAIEEAK